MRLLENAVLDRFSTTNRRWEVGGTDELLKRAQLLSERDRILVELHFQGRLTHRQIARAMHLKDYQVTRRLRAIGRRLHNPIVAHLLDPDCPLTAEFRQLGIEFHLQGQSVRAMADRHRMHTSSVRKILAYLDGWRKGKESPQ